MRSKGKNERLRHQIRHKFLLNRIQSQAAGTVRPPLSALLEVPESKHETLSEKEKKRLIRRLRDF